MGTSLLEALVQDDEVDSVLGIARRLPQLTLPKVQWEAADIIQAPLADLFEGADAVIHLAWLIQPSHDREALRTTNVEGSGRVFDAVARARVPALVYASSVGAYSPGPKDTAVDESWPTEGISTSFYAADKAAVRGSARFLRASTSFGPGRSPSPRADLQVDGGNRDPEVVCRAARSACGVQARRDSVLAPPGSPAVPGGSCRRCRRGLSTRDRRLRDRSVQHRGGAGARFGTACADRGCTAGAGPGGGDTHACGSLVARSPAAHSAWLVRPRPLGADHGRRKGQARVGVVATARRRRRLGGVVGGNAPRPGRQDATARSGVEWPVARERVPHRHRRSSALGERLARGATSKRFESTQLITRAISERLDVG